MRAIATATAVLLAGVSGAAWAAGKPAPKPAARPAATPSAGGPVVYWVSASTTTGMGGMSATGRPNMAAMMSGAYNPNAVSHTLLLQLGSPRRPQGEASAEHVPPADLGAGASLPLVTPRATPAMEGPRPPMSYERPNGRMLIFWGCGEHAGPGQPVVIDFARLGQGQGGAQMASLMAVYANLGGTPPSAGRHATYGEWPNERGRTSVPGDGSLAGAHLVRGNYSPDINFTLTPSQDFLPQFQLTSNAIGRSGAGNLAWRGVDGASAYFASMIGGGGDNTMVMWTSSQVQASGFGIPEFLNGGDIRRLLASKVLMDASTLNCAVPAEAVRAAGQSGMFNLSAYADDVDFAFPPRPADPKVAWAPQWTVKVRYRSATSGILGMADMGNDDGGRPPRSGQQPRQPPRRPSGGFPAGGDIWP